MTLISSQYSDSSVSGFSFSNYICLLLHPNLLQSIFSSSPWSYTSPKPQSFPTFSSLFLIPSAFLISCRLTSLARDPYLLAVREMASLGSPSFLPEASRLRKSEQRFPCFSWGILKIRSLRAGNRQFSLCSGAGEEDMEVLSMKRGLVLENLLHVAKEGELFSLVKLEAGSTVEQALSDTNSSSNYYIESAEAKPSEIPSVGVSESFHDKAKKPTSKLPGQNSVVGDLELLKKADSESKKITSVAPSLLQSIEKYEAKDGKSEDLIEPNAKSSNTQNDMALEEDNKPSPLAGVNVMNFIWTVAECAPWSKTGGLGDVAGALPKAMARRGHRVMVVVPKYGDYPEAKDTGVRKRYKVHGQDMEVTFHHAYIDGVDFVFIENSEFRHSQHNIYGGDRLVILKRMVLFCKAAVEVPWHVPCGGSCYGDGNLAFIANDWHTALLPVYLKAYYRDHGVMKYARSVLVIHNVAHQGRGPVDDFLHLDLPEHYIDLFKLYDPVGGDHFNIFAAGLKAADRIVTVSHGYAWELKTVEGGWGLHEIINYNDWKFRGIVNGIDVKEWSPKLDMHLQTDGYTNYSLETLKSGKPKCKAALQKELNLPIRPEVPVIAFIGRLDFQKGVDLIAEAMHWIVGQDVQLIMLGTGRPDLEDMLKRFEGQHHDKVRGWVGFSVKLAHRITAGADVLLMPSRFEPCGLNQLYAMAYGTIPVVHGVGGLKDTVIQFDPYNETGFGWTFDKAEAGRLIDALGNCLNTYWNYKSSWEGLQTRGMMQDLSWDNAAQIYEEVLVAAKYQW